MNDPIDNIEWLEAGELQANNYNPNVVYTPELRLLERNILIHGWIQPMLVTTEMVIIDGFHRWSLSRDSKKLIKKYGGKVPCAVLDLTVPEAMLLTIRINRAKGTHVAYRMSHVVRSLVDDHGLTQAEIGEGIGATAKEVELLYQEDVFAAKDIKNATYSKAWIPKETAHDG